eukprot:4644501-Alexandrium_andersonii.AAC.1
MIVLVRRPTRAQTRSPQHSRGPFRAIFCAECEHGNENLPGAAEGSFCVVAGSGRRGSIDSAGNGGRIKRVAQKLPLFVAP